MPTRDFLYEFSYNAQNYLAEIVHFSQLTREEIARHQIQQQSFLIHLFSTHSGYTSFELFIGDNLEWETNSTLSIDEEIIQLLGIAIDHHSM